MARFVYKIRHGFALLILLMAAAPQSYGQEPDALRYSQVPSDAFSVMAEIRAKPGKEAELRAATLPLIKLVRGDPKTIAYFLQEDREANGHFFFYEVFANEADFEAHNAKPYVQAWFAKLPELAQGSVKAIKMKVLTAPTP